MNTYKIYLEDSEIVTFAATHFDAEEILYRFNEATNWEVNYELEKID